MAAGRCTVFDVWGTQGSSLEDSSWPEGTFRNLAWRRTPPYAVVNTVVMSIAFRGSPYGGTERCTGLGRRMLAAPLGPSVKLPVGPRNAVLGGGGACELRHQDLRWSSLCGHEALCWMGETYAGCATGTF
eukprot:3900352-Pyramimonas_sp.AAC.1